MAVVSEALRICESLEGILKKSFGPNGLDVMLNSSSGSILVTNNSTLILRSLNLGHPVGRSVVDKILSHTSITGDGGSSFLLILTAVLREVVRHTEIKGMKFEEKEVSSAQQKALIALSQAFLKLESTFVDEVVSPVLESIAIKQEINASPQNIRSIKETIKSIIVTALDGKFPVFTVNLYGTLLCDVVMNTWRPSVSPLLDTILQIIDDFSQVCFETPCVSLSLSHFKPGILIPRQFGTEKEEVVPRKYKYFGFVVLTCSLDCSDPDTSATFRVSNAFSLDSTLKWKRTQVQRIVTMFKQNDIKLILSSENLSDQVLHYCRQNDLAVVKMIPVDCISYICRSSGILSISALDFDSQALAGCFMGKALHCGNHFVGHHKFVHLELLLGTQQLSPHSLVLCAPAESLCRQSFIALHNVLKCVKMSFSQDGKRMLTLPGGGSAEFATSFILHAYAQDVIDPESYPALKILSDALLTIPNALHSNSLSPCHQKESFVSCVSEVEHYWKNCGVLLGISFKTGKPLKVLDAREPLTGKCLLLRHLLQCVAQLLKTDKIVGVSTG